MVMVMGPWRIFLEVERKGKGEEGKTEEKRGMGG